MYALPGKLLMGTSGFVVDAVGYPWFFVYTSSLGIPALVMLYFLSRPEAKERARAGADAR
jgi:PAT family beta-lactamase induction signal transducer AmpG